jgi:hypothetical protein
VRPADDCTQPVGPEPSFNESMYFHFHDPQHGIGGFFRLANRPNEGRGERTACLFLPGRRVAFGFERPEVHDNEALRGAGLTFAVETPFQRLGVEFDGIVHLLTEPAAMANPKSALARSALLDCSATLSFAAAAPAYAETFDGDGESFAPNHYEQLMTVTGQIRLGDQTLAIKGGACATTPGGRGLGRHRGSTGGRTEQETVSASWPPTSGRRTPQRSAAVLSGTALP